MLSILTSARIIIQHHAAAIAEEMKALDVFAGVKTMDYDEAVAKGLITILGKDMDDKFLANVLAQINDKASVAQVADDFKAKVRAERTPEGEVAGGSVSMRTLFEEVRPSEEMPGSSRA